VNALEVSELNLTGPDGKSLSKELSFRIEPGEVLALMGPSGSGKSSILSWLTGTLAPGFQSSGEVWLGKERLTQLPTEKRGLGLMLQQDYLFPHMSVGQNLKFGLSGGTRAERHRRMSESLELAGLSGMADRNPATLSGGQRARVSLLRTLPADPQAVLLDEPFSRLDVELREQIRQFAWSTCEDFPVLLVTHDKFDVPAAASTIVLNSNSDGEWRRQAIDAG
jgi:putative thiamine transport system ATP-binding protein